MHDDIERREVHYTGRVQGVGFRYTTVRIAKRHDVRGYVQNLSDGSVEVVAEGAYDELNAFFDAVAEALRDNIREARQVTYAATDEFEDFGIRF